MGVSIGAPL